MTLKDLVMPSSAGNNVTMDMALYSQDAQGNLHLQVTTGSFFLATGTNTIGVSPVQISAGTYWLMYGHAAGGCGLYFSTASSVCLVSNATGNAPDPFPVPANQAASCMGATSMSVVGIE
jgi:hypothetical protein